MINTLCHTKFQADFAMIPAFATSAATSSIGIGIDLDRSPEMPRTSHTRLQSTNLHHRRPMI